MIQCKLCGVKTPGGVQQEDGQEFCVRCDARFHGTRKISQEELERVLGAKDQPIPPALIDAATRIPLIAYAKGATLRIHSKLVSPCSITDLETFIGSYCFSGFLIGRAFYQTHTTAFHFSSGDADAVKKAQEIETKSNTLRMLTEVRIHATEDAYNMILGFADYYSTRGYFAGIPDEKDRKYETGLLLLSSICLAVAEHYLFNKSKSPVSPFI